jgi:hypothetical protein
MNFALFLIDSYEMYCETPPSYTHLTNDDFLIAQDGLRTFVHQGNHDPVFHRCE